MTELPFRQIDVFGSGPFSGNPLAVILDADDLTTEQMVRISEWTNLSECTFVLKPTDPAADYRVRIFSLSSELPFAGHPTLGTARAWLDAGGVPRTPGAVVQECGVGLVPLRHDGASLAFAAPPLQRSGPVDDAFLKEVCGVLGISPDDVVDASWVDNGPGWVGLLLKDADAVLAVAPTAPSGGRWDIGIAGLHPEGSDLALEVRAFFCHDGGVLREDPVTGSLNASLAQWLTSTGRLAAPYAARQGVALGRDGRILVEESDAQLWIGGATEVSVSGTIEV
ncbi:PhzF family phenazine biosynthesis protein [Demequina zhanjiangensis]|uniref:PhzF family phenazine biosynthesis protein n=1 Tax=Demequina zhanjiangensis TaxID=3051659 RepID=A0ABT8FY47_9MICO|nr:PhzF family phenazine biosynthesis protein [Demequina sp. SYSU T00b26]MDN4471825.1 PhzF family phenazine biosynthesis protein [Demequina sp. SYSU T00b26]